MKEEATVGKKIKISREEKERNNERPTDKHKEATVNWERSTKWDGIIPEQVKEVTTLKAG
jgi:hypothetical protein